MNAAGLTRRRLLQAGAAGWLGRSAAAQPASPLAAEAFVQSVGVNVHLGSEPYASGFDRVRSLLGTSGIGHLRDELRPDNDLGRWRSLHDDFGIRSNLLVSPATNTVPQMLDYLNVLGVERVSAIEGQNEGDSDWFMANPAANGNWSVTVVAYQRAVYAALRARYPASVLPILSPSLLDWKPADVWLIRRAAPYCDVVAIHPYVQHGQEPETTDSDAGLGWYLQHMRDSFKPGAPVMATEAGYTNVVKPGGAGMSETATAIYLPRLLLHNFAAGVQRTFLYELMDGGADPIDGEHHWGLVRHDGSPKPAYAAVTGLLKALQDPAPAAVSVTPAISVTADRPPPALRLLPLQRRDGSVIVALWLAVRVWDPAQAVDIAVPTQAIALGAPGIKHAAWLAPDGAASWTSLPVVDSRVTVPVGAKVALVRLAAA